MGANSVLIVDDDPDVLDALLDMCQAQGLEPVCCSNGQEALGIVTQTRFPLMILDIGLQDMTGIELCKTIRERNPISYMIAMTGDPVSYTATECRAVGFDDYMVKPIMPEMLEESVHFAQSAMQRWLTRSA